MSEKAWRKDDGIDFENFYLFKLKKYCEKKCNNGIEDLMRNEFGKEF